MAVLPTHAIKQRTATLIKRRNHPRIFHRQFNLPTVEQIRIIRVKKRRFGIKIRPQCRIGTSNRLLHRPMRKNHVEQQRHATIQRRTEQNHQGIHQPHAIRLMRQCGIRRHRQSTKCNRTVTQTNRAEPSKAKRDRGHPQHKPHAFAQHDLRADGGKGKGAQGKQHVFQPPCQAMIQIHQTACNNPQHQRHRQRWRVNIPHKHRSDQHTDEDGNRIDNFRMERAYFHGIAIEEWRCAVFVS